MKSFRRAIAATICLLAMTFANAQKLYVIGIPHQADRTNAQECLRLIAAVGMQAESGDRFVIVDASNQAQLTDFTIPNTSVERTKLRAVVRGMGNVTAHFRTTGLIAGNPPYRVHLPRFLDKVGSFSGHDEVQALIIGSMYFGNGSDTRFDYTAGTYLSDGHIHSTRDLSVFGTANTIALTNTRLHVLNLEPIADDLDRQPILRFLTLYAAARGVILTEWTTDFASVPEPLLRGDDEPVVRVAIDQDDLRREVRRAGRPSGIPNQWTLVVCVDASASMTAVYEAIRAQMPQLAERLYDAGAEIQVAIIPFREVPLDAMPLTSIRSTGSDGGQSVARLNRYLNGVNLESTAVDPVAAVNGALAMLANHQGPEAFTCVVVVGDTGPETQSTPADQQRLMRDLAAWRAAGDHRSVHPVYLGDPSSDQVAFFRDLAAVSGHDLVRSIQSLAERIVAQAADVTRGLAD